MLSVEAVDVKYGSVQALHQVSLSVKVGEVVALIGANGAGKTTTLRAISAVLRPVAGQIILEGRSLNTLSADQVVRLGMSLVPEGRRIFPDLTVTENLMVGSYSRRDRSTVRKDLHKMLERFPNLGERRNQLGANLSGGEQQMLAIARAKMSNPRLLLLDEPSMGLAPLMVKEVFKVIGELNADGVTILMVEQNARMALRYAQRGYVLENGRIVLSGAADTLQSDPEVQRRYLGGESKI